MRIEDSYGAMHSNFIIKVIKKEDLE